MIPLITGLGLFFVRSESASKNLAFFSTLVSFALMLAAVSVWDSPHYLVYDHSWLGALNSRFHFALDGMSKLLCLLTVISFPLIIYGTWNNSYEDSNRFYGLLLLSQAGLLGVFLSMDALLFYFFWELALIPLYFLSSRWGGERRIPVTIKFFVYTFLGSLFMLIGMIILYNKAGQSFAYSDFLKLKMSANEEFGIFLLLLLAFAIKMPLWPFHTWQPDTYEQSPTPVTAVLSGVMAKMGVFGLLRWLAPVVPAATYQYGDNVATLAVIGMLYASFVALQQDDLKRLVAYSSIAHIGLMILAVFAPSFSGIQGVMIQMFSHGINILGMWLVVNAIEQQFGTRKISDLGGIAQKAPALTLLLVIVALANIAMPLTNAFIGEFMMFNGVLGSTATKFGIAYAVAGGLTIILGAVYTLRMIQRVFYGETNALTANATDISLNVQITLAIIVVAILVVGIYPKPILSLTEELSQQILNRMNLK
ncbi:complex I subunit 4 family protein [Flavihumibacter petaseus]|uniref:NADH--quinone oxidoreductase subunit M n=1 Tax=Flavihumibacter petaseus NBRC 106054 TaxID=1220578 RepID=A0A0E9MUR0_9BACT|nr:NADH-quinone oxidoreductase subunit M [Flavihumibacter petaseus]GAO41482.1 NADH--quinone oxidoreductase subunit M [Flavihumibacter petaseus NBRC 106054]